MFWKKAGGTVKSGDGGWGESRKGNEGEVKVNLRNSLGLESCVKLITEGM